MLGSADYQLVLTVLSIGCIFVVSPPIPRVVETFGEKRAFVAALRRHGGRAVGIALSTPPSLLGLAFVFFRCAAPASLWWGNRRLRGRGRRLLAGALTQPPGALNAIRYLTAGPALFLGIGAAIMLAYPLTEERFREVIPQIAFRRATARAPWPDPGSAE